jgi:phospholipase C
VITFDEWGGFFDHVPPPVAPLPDASRAAGDVDGRLGFRVPTMLIAPWAARGYVAHDVYDHTSILRLIAWRWGLEPLTVRDATVANLATALDWSRLDRVADQYTVPAGPFGGPCPASGPAQAAHGDALRSLASTLGWPGVL